MAPDPILITCVGVSHDLALLPHFIDHYSGLGIRPERMHIILNSAEADDPSLEQAEAIARSRGVTNLFRWIEPYTSDGMWQRRRDLQADVATIDDWVVSADVDEFHEYPLPLAEFLTACEEMKVNAVSGVFIDILAPGGALIDVAPTPPILEQFPIRADVTFSVWRSGEYHGLGGTMKLMAMRRGIQPRRGGHGALGHPDLSHLYGDALDMFVFLMNPAQRFRFPTRVYHCHWTANLPDRLQRRLETPGASKAGSEYGQKQLDHIAQHGGIDLAQVSLEEPGQRPAWRAEVARYRRWSWYLRRRKRVMQFLGRE